ncbi:helix-turn-helix domain-containing protein [Brucella pseudogrignonensis]|uniref:helix-turn-helix transcriptional regulator n=1 Tax=Brucella pseudogrignonensis TaxID=419475 RepID=UPI001E2E13E1|nr:helix-turn-helix domain-containing protein [Brucella pseudogrignonensis]MCD4512186.1 helix-turn-helix domain-containing protein [Brucella pseudogrignonensis]
MQDVRDNPLPRFMRTPEAAKLLSLSVRTLEKHRCKGTGPAYRKLGGRVVYTVADLTEWIEEKRRRSTGQATGKMAGRKHALIGIGIPKESRR